MIGIIKPAQLLLIFIVATSAFAGPITYNINFTGVLPPLPTSGSFTYDDTSTTFSGFEVSWNGQTYNLTAEANAPFIIGDPCTGPVGAAASFAALNGNCGGVVWLAGNNPPTRTYFGVSAGLNPPALAIFQDGAPVGDADLAISGGLTITAVPEPSTVLTALIAGAFLARKRIGQRGRPANLHGRQDPVSQTARAHRNTA